MPNVVQVNVKPDSPGEAGLPKVSIPTTRFTVNGLDGDYNRFRVNKKQNDPDMAVMLISMDILNDLNNEGWPVMPGDLGENLTLENIDYSSIQPGQKYAVGSAEIEISIICDPCTNLSALNYVKNEKISEFIKTLMNRRGWYARVIKEGEVSSGDKVKLIR